MPTTLFVAGKDFKAKKFVHEKNFPVERMFGIGESRSIASGNWEMNGFTARVSDIDFDQFSIQIEDCIRYLKKYYPQLEAMQNYGMPEYINVDFGIKSEIDNERPIWTLYLPPELIELCGKLRISIEMTLFNPLRFE